MAEYVDYPREAFTLPAPGEKFSKRDVERMIKEVCDELISEDRPYIFEEAQPLIKELGGEIQQRVVRLGYARYKLVTFVTVTPSAHQGLRVASRCLWDPDTDNYASYTFSSEHMHVSVLMYGVYWE